MILLETPDLRAANAKCEQLESEGLRPKVDYRVTYDRWGFWVITDVRPEKEQRASAAAL